MFCHVAERFAFVAGPDDIMICDDCVMLCNQIIDEEVARILHDAADAASTTLQQNRDKLNALAEALLEKEMLAGCRSRTRW